MRYMTVRRMLKALDIPYDNVYHRVCDEMFERMKGIPDEKVKNVESVEHRKWLDILKEVYYRREDCKIEIKDNYDEYH
jgi:hypothetical protein